MFTKSLRRHAVFLIALNAGSLLGAFRRELTVTGILLYLAELNVVMILGICLPELISKLWSQHKARKL